MARSHLYYRSETRQLSGSVRGLLVSIRNHTRLKVGTAVFGAIFVFLAAWSQAQGATAEPTQSAEYKRGRLLFIQCRACHELQPATAEKVGPHLGGIIGRPPASADGFSYSPALIAAKLRFDKVVLDQWLEKPSAVVPGNVMAFSGIPNAADRAALIRYLEVETAPR